MDDRCYYQGPECYGKLWECQACGDMFCEYHWHNTDLGFCVECAACEELRLEDNDDDL